MNEAVIRERLLELCETMSDRQDDAQEGSSCGVYISQSATGQHAINESIEVLRTHIKYLLFDLEATRRENRYLRRMLDGRTKPDGEDANGKGFNGF